MEKFEWCGYLMVTNFEDMFIRFDMIHERDRQHHATAIAKNKVRGFV